MYFPSVKMGAEKKFDLNYDVKTAKPGPLDFVTAHFGLGVEFVFICREVQNDNSILSRWTHLV